MNTVLILVALVLIAASFFFAARYVLFHFHGTFTAWGASHYSRLSGTDETERD